MEEQNQMQQIDAMRRGWSFEKREDSGAMDTHKKPSNPGAGLLKRQHEKGLLKGGGLPKNSNEIGRTDNRKDVVGLNQGKVGAQRGD